MQEEAIDKLNCVNKGEIHSLNSKNFKSDLYRAFFVSFFRMIFYFIIVYGSMLCGLATMSKILIFNRVSLHISGLFIPFVFIYSMLFELTEVRYFPHYETKMNALKAYLSIKGNYWLLGWTSIIITILFFIFLAKCISNNYLPLIFYPITLTLHFALAGFLFSNKYRKLNIDRKNNSQEERTLFKLMLFKLISISYLISMTIFSISAILSYGSNEFGVLYLVMLIILIVFVISIYIGNKSKTKLFESPFIREPFFLFGILFMPFITGIYASHYIGNNKMELLFFLQYLITSQKYISALIILFGIGLALELMRYLGRCNESHYIKEINKNDDNHNDKQTKINERFHESVQNYMIILIIVLSLCPILYYFGEFETKMNIFLTPLFL